MRFLGFSKGISQMLKKIGYNIFERLLLEYCVNHSIETIRVAERMKTDLSYFERKMDTWPRSLCETDKKALNYFSEVSEYFVMTAVIALITSCHWKTIQCCSEGKASYVVLFDWNGFCFSFLIVVLLVARVRWKNDNIRIFSSFTLFARRRPGIRGNSPAKVDLLISSDSSSRNCIAKWIDFNTSSCAIWIEQHQTHRSRRDEKKLLHSLRADLPVVCGSMAYRSALCDLRTISTLA